jgi:hypothetical protein
MHMVHGSLLEHTVMAMHSQFRAPVHVRVSTATAHGAVPLGLVWLFVPDECPFKLLCTVQRPQASFDVLHSISVLMCNHMLPAARHSSCCCCCCCCCCCGSGVTHTHFIRCRCIR